eukprot:1188202-Prorocentrum_minimum.AAC.1
MTFEEAESPGGDANLWCPRSYDPSNEAELLEFLEDYHWSAVIGLLRMVLAGAAPSQHSEMLPSPLLVRSPRPFWFAPLAPLTSTRKTAERDPSRRSLAPQRGRSLVFYSGQSS